MKNIAYRNYIDGAFDNYPFSNDGERETVENFLDWLQNEYKPTRGTVHEPSWWVYANAEGQHPAIVLDDEDLQSYLDEDSYDKLSDDDKSTLLDAWADRISEALRAPIVDDVMSSTLDLACEDTGVQFEDDED